MKCEPVNTLLVKKYNTPLPRYTSYPTVPIWKCEPDTEQWFEIFQKTFDTHNHINGISLYIHLPFCESLCTYCGCNKKITTNHSVEEEYISALEKEWLQYRKLMKQTPVIREIHFGGGTPTFFTPNNLKRIINFIKKGSIVHPNHDFSIEGHPNNTTLEHLSVLYNEGFRRISYGVQDSNTAVQQIINRHQPWENVLQATNNARSLGYKSINFDLIYGLPLQTLESIEHTINQVIELRPDRIAFYSYAHVPWTSKAQRLFNESHLPDPEEKIALYLKGKELLLNNGYVDIGMDHFALPQDDLYKAWESGNLHRNFMGYTTQNTSLLIGLGVSAISEAGNAYAQNIKTLHDYYYNITQNKPAIQKTYILTTLDQQIKKYILDICCKGVACFKSETIDVLEKNVFPKFLDLEKDGLISWNRDGLSITNQGRYFIRNICSTFDLYLSQTKENLQIFSKAI